MVHVPAAIEAGGQQELTRWEGRVGRLVVQVERRSKGRAFRRIAIASILGFALVLSLLIWVVWDHRHWDG